nr:MAG TPA: NADH-PPase NADH pyrophosphatase zinc ribbon domain [Caudoviricetes sp.]
MVRVYVYCVKCGKMTVDDVPERWREAVKAALEK